MSDPVPASPFTLQFELIQREGEIPEPLAQVLGGCSICVLQIHA